MCVEGNLPAPGQATHVSSRRMAGETCFSTTANPSAPLFPPLAVMSGGRHSVPVGPNVCGRTMTWPRDEKNTHGWRGCEGGGGLIGGGKPGATGQTASPSEPCAVIVGLRGRHMAGVRPAGDTTCRDGCRGVDDQRKPRSGASLWQGLG